MRGVQDKAVIVTGVGGSLGPCLLAIPGGWPSSQNDGVTFATPRTLQEISQRWPNISDMSDAKPETSPV